MKGKHKYREARVGGVLSAEVETRVDGIQVLRSREPLGNYPARLTDCLERWARERPVQVLVAQRDKSGDWCSLTYGQMLDRCRAVGQALVRRGLSAERPVAILSGNDIEHLTLALGAMWVGVACAAISPAYSLISQDYEKLRHVMRILTPGLVFASHGEAFAKAIDAAVSSDTEIALEQGTLSDHPVTSFEELLNTIPTRLVDEAHASVDGNTIVKFLFTSGSTNLPRAVTHTHRMLCSNQQMILQTFPFLADQPPVLVDWLPWNHTFGGNHNVGIVLYNGGTLYIDEGKPTPQGLAETLRNLREISPTVYYNVPKGFEAIAAAMERDEVLRTSLFKRCRMMFFAGAGLSQAVWDQLDRLAERTIGERILMATGLGMTETSPAATFAVKPGIGSGHIGLPSPGVEVKLVPIEDKIEIRFRGPHVMPGYWRAPESTREVFDEEGYYRTGDAVKFVDDNDLQKGLLFDGRLAEDFKLSTGTFVSVGPLRTKVILAGAPYVQDVVVTAPDRDEVGILVFPRLEDCRRLSGLGALASEHAVLTSAPLRNFLQGLVDSLATEATGSSHRVARAAWLIDPPSIDKGEVTDKGSVNQRAVLTHRVHTVEALYDDSNVGIVRPKSGIGTTY